AARATRDTKVVVIDPRRTASCEIADLHLQIAIGSDVALFSGLLSYLASSVALDRQWIAAHTNGFSDAVREAERAAGNISEISRASGLAQDAITTFYEWFAKTERTVTVFSQGVNQSSAGTDKVNAIINCHLATGRIGR